MAGDRANVLRSVHAMLEGYEPLAAVLEHTEAATTVEGGARIFGDDIRLEELPLPCIVLSFDGGEAVTQVHGLTEWQLAAFLYASTVYEAADVLDQIEALANDFNYDPDLDKPLNRFAVTSHERLEPVGPAQRLLAWRINLEVSWLP